MKIKVLSRDDADYLGERSTDSHKNAKNIDPKLHPFEKPIEYKRALNAVKMDRVFAKPFVSALSGHRDGVYSLIRHPSQLNWVLSGGCDGEIRLWNASTSKCIGDWRAHSSFVRGLAFCGDQNRVYSCGSDKLIQLWDLPRSLVSGINDEVKEEPKSIKTWMCPHSVTALDHQRKSTNFGTVAANILNVWDPERSEAIQKMSWGEDSLISLKFNPIETYVLGTTAEDRAIILYDVRGNTPIKKVILQMKSNAMVWNPMEAFHFTVANEDHNAYTFDMRNLGKAMYTHSGHVSALLAIDYSPTGQEFVTGSYDKTLRIFEKGAPQSRDVYYTKRMQRIFSICYTGDSTYILSGSDDTNIRIWKSEASKNLRIKNIKEVEKEEYSKALIDRYKEFPEVKRILKKRHLPLHVKTVSKTKAIIKKSQREKEEKRKRHSKKGSVPVVPPSKKSIVKEVS
uniref:DDB1- and CUL4-associated factor 13 n=1 Tax=Arcella intermedia TaxID=1963864 RepID=A0A6B2L418_9EUKA|eukprot:TRINITY_DN619_c0_g1_i1.p1 TRINITY_DN619_c0_g1~~TRINITY_DN619_c0_g1_i1.p1  ORF type:complete len:454 (-),score=96.51 TRINITY_DN619_c0_g1_i1:29-1390(-)